MVLPTEQEIGKWLLDTLTHSCHIEYFLQKLNYGQNDPQRPHDLVGTGNKFEWEAIKGFSLYYRKENEELFQEYIFLSLEFHRQQRHHQMWNHHNPLATKDDLMLGAVDAVCSLLENRGYSGGNHPYDEILEIAEINLPHKIDWMKRAVAEMRQLEQPPIHSITSLDNFPNIGISDQSYNIIKSRLEETLDMLEQHRYSKNLIKTNRK